MTINEIKPYEGNAKLHNEKQIELLAKVVREVGWRQNVEVNQKGVIVAGHGRWLVWQKHKDTLPPIWVVDDTGKTIHGAHSEKSLTEEQEKMWRLADNQINAMTSFDLKLVIQELKLMQGEMVSLTGFSQLLEESKNTYTKKITTPLYEPKNVKPELNFLYDKANTENFLKAVEASSLGEQEKDFLRHACYRLTVFHFDKIADYYAHSEGEMKALIEKLALVIIDFNSAIETGYVKACDELFLTLENE